METQNMAKMMAWAGILFFGLVAHALSSSTSSPPPNCGLVCAPKAEISIAVSPLYAKSLLENHPFSLLYTVTNESPFTLQGFAEVTLNGEGLENIYPQEQMTIAPGQNGIGAVWVNSAPSGNSSVIAKFFQPIECTRPIGIGLSGDCTGGQLYATGELVVYVPADADKDNLSDDLENWLLMTYTPLMLYSQDHGQQEQYAPIDVVDYASDSSLKSAEAGISGASHSQLEANPMLILNPGPDFSELGGTIYSSKALSSLPRKLFLSPSSAAKSGSPWSTVLPSRKVGLYGHVTAITPSQINDPDVSSDLLNSYGNELIYKVEYWQFFGYSHDFELPSWALPVGVIGYSLGCAWLVPLCVVWPAVASQAGDPYTEADHDGDWCSVQLFIDQRVSTQSPAALPNQGILAVYHFAHGNIFGFARSGFDNATTQATPQIQPILHPPYDIQEYEGPNFGKPVKLTRSMSPSDPNLENAQNNALQLAKDESSGLYVHPVVYVEWGGHEFWPTSGWSYAEAGKHGGDGYSYFADTPPNVGEIENPLPGDAASLITAFAGYWGLYGGFADLNPPPQGPPLHRQWQWNPNGPPNPTTYRPAKPPY